jgi:hypothetical protein
MKLKLGSKLATREACHPSTMEEGSSSLMEGKPCQAV